MADTTLLGPWVRRYLLEHLKGERNLALNTRRSYRDALALLLPFLAKDIGKPIDRLKIEHVICRPLPFLPQTSGGISPLWDCNPQPKTGSCSLTCVFYWNKQS